VKLECAARRARGECRSLQRRTRKTREGGPKAERRANETVCTTSPTSRLRRVIPEFLRNLNGSFPEWLKTVPSFVNSDTSPSPHPSPTPHVRLRTRDAPRHLRGRQCRRSALVQARRNEPRFRDDSKPGIAFRIGGWRTPERTLVFPTTSSHCLPIQD
jgi:hypothetical protein